MSQPKAARSREAEACSPTEPRDDASRASHAAASETDRRDSTCEAPASERLPRAAAGIGAALLGFTTKAAPLERDAFFWRTAEALEEPREPLFPLTPRRVVLSSTPK